MSNLSDTNTTILPESNIPTSRYPWYESDDDYYDPLPTTRLKGNDPLASTKRLLGNPELPTKRLLGNPELPTKRLLGNQEGDNFYAWGLF